jgi:RNA recognition motif-containing protein
VWEVTIPVKPDGSMRGFAFIGFTCKGHAEKGIAQMNGQKVAGRTVAVDWAVAKWQYTEGGAPAEGAWGGWRLRRVVHGVCDAEGRLDNGGKGGGGGVHGAGGPQY